MSASEVDLADLVSFDQDRFRCMSFLRTYRMGIMSMFVDIRFSLSSAVLPHGLIVIVICALYHDSDRNFDRNEY
jgi:hypothetical protein